MPDWKNPSDGLGGDGLGVAATRPPGFDMEAGGPSGPGGDGRTSIPLSTPYTSSPPQGRGVKLRNVDPPSFF